MGDRQRILNVLVKVSIALKRQQIHRTLTKKNIYLGSLQFRGLLAPWWDMEVCK